MSSNLSDLGKTRHSPLGSLPDDPRRSSNAAGLRKQIAVGGACNGNLRASVKPSGPHTRYSKGSFRNSVRVTGQNGMSGISTLGALEKMQVVDEDGKDRTPKPLLASRSYVQTNDSSMWSGEAPESISIIERQARPSAVHLLSSASFKFDNTTKGATSKYSTATQFPLPTACSPPSGESLVHQQAPTSAEQASSTALFQRSRSTQLSRNALTSSGCQVVPWELALPTTQQEGPGGPQQMPMLLRGDDGVSSEPAGGVGLDHQEDGELANFLHTGMGPQEPLVDGRLGGGLSRTSSFTQDTPSRRSTASSQLTWEPSERGSMMSRASMATFVQDGGSGYKWQSGVSTGSRSLVVPGLRQGSHALSLSEVAAEVARRQRAEAQRALARLPRIHASLECLEKAVVQNAYHSVMVASRPLPGCTFQHPPANHSTASESDSQDQDACVSEEPHTNGTQIGDLLKPHQPSDNSKGVVVEHAGDGDNKSAVDVATELPQLWQWRLPGSGDGDKDLPVSCIAWNKVSPDLVAVGYGELDHSVSVTGVVALFSLRNPGNPVWQLATRCGVSALDFSARTGSVLAVGMFDGSIAVYDVRGRGGALLARVPPAGPRGQGGHGDPVWSIRYVTWEGKGQERLVSISTDGRVLAWKHAQSMEHVELMRLKLNATRRRMLHGLSDGADAATEQQAEGLLGRHAGGTCFDFHPSDHRTYLVGTQEGLVHRCTTTFNQQQSQTYSGHSAPVYQVRWCPFLPSIFLTCSADWTLRLWREDQAAPLWTFQPPSTQSEVADAQWCPHSSTVFAAAAGNTLQLWDMEHSVLRPRTSVTRYGVRLACVAFSPTFPVLLCGADDGSVTAYSTARWHREHGTSGVDSARLEAVLRSSVYQHRS